MDFFRPARNEDPGLSQSRRGTPAGDRHGFIFRGAREISVPGMGIWARGKNLSSAKHKSMLVLSPDMCASYVHHMCASYVCMMI